MQDPREVVEDYMPSPQGTSHTHTQFQMESHEASDADGEDDDDQSQIFEQSLDSEDELPPETQGSVDKLPYMLLQEPLQETQHAKDDQGVASASAMSVEMAESKEMQEVEIQANSQHEIILYTPSDGDGLNTWRKNNFSFCYLKRKIMHIVNLRKIKWL